MTEYLTTNTKTGHVWIAVLDGEAWAGLNSLDLIEVDAAEIDALETGAMRLRDVRGRRVAFVETAANGLLSLHVRDLPESDA